MKREIRNVKIVSTYLGYEGHNIFTFLLTTLGDSIGQSFGNYGLKHQDYGIPMIESILKTVGVDSWEELKGKHIRLDAENGKVYGIGHITEDKWFYPEDK